MAYLVSFLYQTIWRSQKEEVGNKAFQEHRPPPGLRAGLLSKGEKRQEGWVRWVGTEGSQSQALRSDSLSREGLLRNYVEIHRQKCKNHGTSRKRRLSSSCSHGNKAKTPNQVWTRQRLYRDGGSTVWVPHRGSSQALSRTPSTSVSEGPRVYI